MEEQKEASRIAVNQVFGYHSITRTWIEDNNFDFEQFAKEEGWICHPGVLAVSFLFDSECHIVEFGKKPDKKTFKRMIREAKGINNGKNKPKSNS